jgi:hypothetical protein
MNRDGDFHKTNPFVGAAGACRLGSRATLLDGPRWPCRFVDKAKRIVLKPHRLKNSKQRACDVLQNAEIFTRCEQDEEMKPSWPFSSGVEAGDAAGPSKMARLPSGYWWTRTGCSHLRNLEAAAVPRAAIVGADDPILLDAQHVGEGPVGIGHEDRPRLGDRHGEMGVVVEQEAPPVAICAGHSSAGAWLPREQWSEVRAGSSAPETERAPYAPKLKSPSHFLERARCHSKTYQGDRLLACCPCRRRESFRPVRQDDCAPCLCR